MSKNRPPFFFLYQWIIAFPVLLVITALVALTTIFLSPLFPDSKLSYYPARWWARIFCRLTFVRVKVIGLEKLDRKQSCIFISNHQSIYDIFAVYGYIPFIFKWVMKAELRRIPLVGKACEAAGHIFIDRTNPVTARKSLENAETQLQNGVSVVIFPEGTRTYTGEMGLFKRGAFRIATDLLLPIVPITIRGSFERMHRNTLKITPGTIEMIIHDPIDVTPFLPENQAALIQKTREEIYSSLKFD
jgi:1-acyl-sn-glycerol-3-phosphate acyltransferase